MRLPTKIASVLLSLMIMSGAISLPVANTADALSGSQFKAGRIIDDSLFYNGNTMNAAQIQTLLDAKVPSCDTNGTQGPYYDKDGNRWNTRADYGRAHGAPPPYTCLKNFRQNTGYKAGESGLCSAIDAKTNLTAAQIIDNVAQACHISQKVLLVMLQKEQGLVTDDWPWPIQYRGALGYGCPDDAACDSEYYGFFNQVYNAARQFQRYKADPSNWNHVPFMTNNILYQANAPSCGSRSVYIENYATAGLYNYTPYTPNQAALNNLYGTGDDCSAYGNRNFWRYYNDWFGSTIYQRFVRTVESASLYYLHDGIRYAIPSIGVASEYGYSSSQVSYLSQSEMNSLPLSQPESGNSASIGTLVKSTSDTDLDGSTVYLLSGAKKHPIGSMGVLSNYGLTSENIIKLPLSLIHSFPSAPLLSNFVKSLSSSTIYKVESGLRRTIFDMDTLRTANPGGSVSTLGTYTLSILDIAKPLINGPAVISIDGSSYFFVQDTYYGIPSISAYHCWGIDNGLNVKRFRASSASIAQPVSTHSVGCTVKNTVSGTTYLLDQTKKWSSPSTLGFSDPMAVSQFDSLINSIATSPTPLSNSIKSSSSSTIWMIEAGQKRPIPSMRTYTRLGLANTSNITSHAVNSIQTGPVKYASGDLVKSSTSSSVYLIRGNNRLPITSAEIFGDYGYSWGSIMTTSQSGLDTSYPTGQSLSPYFFTSGSLRLANNGMVYVIDPNLDIHYGVNRTELAVSNNYEVAILENLPSQTSLASRFVKSKDSSTIYYLENGSKRPISSWSKYLELSAGGTDKIMVLNRVGINLFVTGNIL